MRYRKLSPSGDSQFGHGSADFWYNVPDAVGQAILTRLKLFAGEWFLDTNEGTPWGGFPINDQVVANGRILGKSTQADRDLAIKQRILGTQGVVAISNYSSELDSSTRILSVSMSVDTIYGQAFDFVFRFPITGQFEVGVSPIGGVVPL